MKWKSMERKEGFRPPDRDGEVWENFLYVCYRYEGKDHQGILMGTEGFPEVIWLSIKRKDQQPIHDWRALQKIKNEVVGKDHEAFELYPAEGRLWDSANQYHLWVFKDTDLRFPVGQPARVICTPKQADKFGAVQRRTNDYK